MRGLGILLAIVLGALPARGEGIVIGSTSFPRGEQAFPSTGACIALAGCGEGRVQLIDASREPVRPVSPWEALVGHTLELVAIGVSPDDEIQLGFPLPIENRDGPELYLGQAEFLGGLKDPADPSIRDLEIRVDGSTWHTIPRARFSKDPLAETLKVAYVAFPNLESDSYSLWIAVVDLSDFGLASGQAVSAIDLRGAPGSPSGLDLALVGSTNPAPGAPGRRAGVALILGALAIAGALLWAKRSPRGRA